MGATSDRLRPLYELRAATQYALPQPLPDPALDRKFGRTLELVAPLLPCHAVLDAGCGDGRFLVAIGDRAERLVGVDIAERILETASAATRAAGLDSELARANLEQLPFPDASFDLVLCSQVVEHLLDPEAGLREIARVLRPGGRAVITTLNRRMLITLVLNAPRQALVRALGLRGHRSPVEYPETAFRLDEFRTLMVRAGFAVEHTETFRFHLRWPLDLPVLQRALNRLDSALPAHGWGDILAAVGRRP